MALVAYITTAGQALISECIGAGLEFTGAQLGDGGDTVEETCRARTALASYKVDASISRVTPTDGSARVTVSYSNASQIGTLSVKEIGIFARKAGTSDSPTLICYANFGDSPDVIQAASAALFARQYEIIIAITGVASVTVTVPSGAYQDVITANGLLVGDGNGNISALPTTYYATVAHTHVLSSSSITGILPVAKGGTNASTAAQALANLGVIYSETEPTYQAGAIWLQPVE